jgi:hypothetical protein
VNAVFFNKIDSILRQPIEGRDGLDGLTWKKWEQNFNRMAFKDPKK